MRRIEGKVCSVCGERVMSIYSQPDPTGFRCPICRRVERPFERAVAYGSYEGGLRELVHLLKYGGVRPAATVLGRMLAEAVAGLDGVPAQDEILVVPVPLYRGKCWRRGFNQAELIACAALRVSPLCDRLKLAAGLLRRTRDTRSQVGLTSHQRRANLRGAFSVDHAAAIRGREVLLVDDVYTTGATASECARVLRRAGASRVWVATAARTMKESGFKVSIFPDLKMEATESDDRHSEETFVTLKH